jgi:hypothetical protein
MGSSAVNIVRCAAVAAPLVVCAGAAAESFSTRSVAVDVGATLRPSAGSFLSGEPVPGQEDLYLSPGQPLVTRSATLWGDFRDSVMASTWFARDRFGPSGPDGSAVYGEGFFGSVTGRPGGPAIVATEPIGTYVGTPDSGLAVNGQNGDPVDGDGLSPGFNGGVAGFGYSGIPGDVDMFSAPSLLGGEIRQSLFVAHLVLSDPTATLVGDDLIIGIRGVGGLRFPLDGGAAYGVDDTGVFPGFRLVQERVTFTNSLGTFTAIDLYIVPAPGGVGAIALGLAAGARRRR